MTGTTVHRTLQTVSVTLADAKTGERQTIVCTPNHPFYVQGQGFTPAGSLGIGTSVVTRAGPSLLVSSVGLQPEQAGASGGTLVYNLTVQGDHTYFVGTVDGGAWVHNEDCTKVAKRIIKQRGSGEVWGIVTRSGAPFPWGGDESGNPWLYHDVVRDGDNIIDTYTNRDLPNPEASMHIDQWKAKFDYPYDFDQFWSFEKGSGNGRSPDPPAYNF